MTDEAKQKEKDTKQKIVVAGTKLFAEKGFYGTSVRDIAQEAAVNIAAVNYHFKSKQALYWEITQIAKKYLSESIEAIREKSDSFEGFVRDVFIMMSSKGDFILTIYKTVLSDAGVPFEHEEAEAFIGQDMGPPGRLSFLKALKDEVGDGFPEEDYEWAVRNIFTFVSHWSLMLNTQLARMCSAMGSEDFSQAGVVPHLDRTVQSTLQYLRSTRTR